MTQLIAITKLAPSKISGLLHDYLAISKFKVVAMLVLTAWVGLALAPDVGRGIGVQFISLLGIGLLSAAVGCEQSCGRQ